MRFWQLSGSISVVENNSDIRQNYRRSSECCLCFFLKNKVHSPPYFCVKPLDLLDPIQSVKRFFQKNIFYLFFFLVLQSWHLILAKSHEYDKRTPFPPFSKFLKIDGNASLSKHNIEAGERGNLFSGGFKADFCQTFKARIVWIFKKIEQGFPLHVS